MGRSTTPSRTALRLAATAGGLALVATVLGGGTASAQEPDGGTPGGETVTVDGVEVTISDNPVLGAVERAALNGPPGPVELYAPLANPGGGNGTGAFGQLFGGVLGTVLGQVAPEAPTCTDNVCGTSPSDLVGP